MATNVVDQVEKLVNLATGQDTNPNEARTAALKACRLIRLHSLKVVKAVARVEEVARESIRDEVRRRTADPEARSGRFSEIARDATVEIASRVAGDMFDELVRGRRR